MNKLKLIVLAFGLIAMMGSLNSKAEAISSNSLNFNSTTPDRVSKYGEDSVSCVRNLSLYREFYKQWKSTKYKDDVVAGQTLTSWRACFFGCPLVSKNMYIHGEKLMKYYIKKNKEDSAVRQAYVDTLFMVYDQRMQYFGQD